MSSVQVVMQMELFTYAVHYTIIQTSGLADHVGYSEH